MTSCNSGFKPAFGLGNRHVQTLAATLLGRLRPIKYNRQTLNLPDDDFVDLDWLNKPLPGSVNPILVIFHGLEGSSYSHYVRELAHYASQAGWSVVVMNFRSCSGELNKQARILTKYLLFADEVELPGGGIRGDEGYRAEFLAER